MKMHNLGSTGVQVSEHCLGAMMFGKMGNPDHDDCVRIIHRALDAGVNFIDTADVYSAGESEEIVGKAIAGRRDDLVIATKVHAPMGRDPNMWGNSRRWIQHEVENSLRRLGTDWIDLYQVHRPDEAADVDDTLGALSDLVHQGKIRYAGSSTFPAEYIVEAQWVAERRGRERFRCEQPPYSILVRDVERSVLPTCQRYGMGVIPWSPLAGGYLAGRYRKGAELPPDSRMARRVGSQFEDERQRAVHEQRIESVEELLKVTADAGITITHLAIAFVLEHPVVTSAIIGPRTYEQLEDLLSCADLRLDPALIDRIDDLVPPGTSVNGFDITSRPVGMRKPARRRSQTA